MSAKSRRKGAAGEIAAAELLATLYPEAHRRIGQTRDGADATDVEGTPFWIEVQLAASTTPNAKMRQAMAATDGRMPLVLTRECSRSKSGPWLATMKAEDLLDLLRRIPT